MSQSTGRYDWIAGALALVIALAIAQAIALALVGLTGCVPDKDLAGVGIPNAAPDTRLTAHPPEGLETGFLVHFHWTGEDQDGRLRGFQWKLCTLGTDGIDVPDTLTVDPATGDTLNPWHFTTGTDTTLIVSADLPGFPGDAELEEEDQRFYQAHAFFVRAVDDQGAIDLTPDFVCFTATTLMPWIYVDRPARLSRYLDAQPMPPTVTFGFTGCDPDFETEMPTKYRYLWKKSWYRDHYIRTRAEFEGLDPPMISSSDSAWSDWLPYPEDPTERLITFADQPARDENDDCIVYLFAIQAMDTVGAVSVDLTYGRNVQNVYISTTMTPLLTMYEPFLGLRSATGTQSTVTIDVAGGQPLEFSWVATAEAYAGVVTGYRYGWDVTDPDDELDPGWAVREGTAPEHRRSPGRSFQHGTHSLTIQVRDNLGQLTRLVWILQVVPVPDWGPLPLLLVDDVADHHSNCWIPVDGPPLDRDPYRDAFWEQVLAGPGGVEGFDPQQDVIDTQVEHLEFRDLMRYRSVIWVTRWSQGSFVWDAFSFDPSRALRYVWLHAYQEQVGNLFLAGSRVMNSFLGAPNWYLPVILSKCAPLPPGYGWDPWYPLPPLPLLVGFPFLELPDGTTACTGILSYSYRSLGLTVLDVVDAYHDIWGCPHGSGLANCRRRSACVGVKALVLDPAFEASYLPGGAIADTIFTESTIDWRDLSPAYRDSLKVYPWGRDEFYEADIAGRPTQWSPQDCDGRPCVEPMFQIYSRFDWVDDLHLAAGDPDWPAPIFGGQDLNSVCGSRALNPTTGRTLTTGQVTAFISHKLVANKPVPRGDVVWGFDPYRFDHAEIGEAIHWVLGEHFGLTMKP